MELTKKSFTRVTLALDIVGKIESGLYRGFHELGAVKHRIDLSDTLSIEESPKDSLECNDPAVPCDARNVCLKAVKLVQDQFGIDRHVRIRLEKHIPVMAGLAGGSANAAATIDLLNELWDLRLEPVQRIDLGRKIGMDIPYYFMGSTCFDSEAGQLLESILTKLSFVFVLAIPEFGVSTSIAYGEIDYSIIGKRQKLTDQLRHALIVNDNDSALKAMHNDFELSVFPRFPRLASIKQELLGAGCSAALLTGSGSTLIGIVRDRNHAKAVAQKLSCRSIIAETKIV